jgi:hypothetical protein
MITDSRIKAAIKRSRTSKSRIELRDNGDRGGGRLTLVVRNFRTHITCEWYALYYRDGKRRFTKLGVIPCSVSSRHASISETSMHLPFLPALNLRTDLQDPSTRRVPAFQSARCSLRTLSI